MINMVKENKFLKEEFINIEKRKLDRIKEIIEPYIIIFDKEDDICNKVVNLFKS